MPTAVIVSVLVCALTTPAFSQDSESWSGTETDYITYLSNGAITGTYTYSGPSTLTLDYYSMASVLNMSIGGYSVVGSYYFDPLVGEPTSGTVYGFGEGYYGPPVGNFTLIDDTDAFADIFAISADPSGDGEIDQISFTTAAPPPSAVPEPSSISLLVSGLAIAGLAIAGGYRRRGRCNLIPPAS
jgi:hypothetical protein